MRSPSRTFGMMYGALLIDSMPPATAMSMSPVCDALVREHHGLEARAADLVDGERGHVIGESALERRLPRRRLADAARHDVAHDAFVDHRRLDARARDRLAHDHGAQFGRREVLERAEKFSGGNANSADDEGVSHKDLILAMFQEPLGHAWIPWNAWNLGTVGSGDRFD